MQNTMINNNDMDMCDLLYDYLELRVCNQDISIKGSKLGEKQISLFENI